MLNAGWVTEPTSVLVLGADWRQKLWRAPGDTSHEGCTGHSVLLRAACAQLFTQAVRGKLIQPWGTLVAIWMA